jgi:hypothetical protein
MPFAAANSREIALHVSEADFNALALVRQLADSALTSYLSLALGSGADMYGNSLGGVHEDGALAVSVYTADTYGPAVRAYSLTMDGSVARLSLTFSEVVDAATLVPRELVLQSAQVQPASFFALSGGSWDAVDGTVVTINITEADLNSIKAIRDLAIGRGSAYLVASRNAVSDMTGNPLVHILASDAL